MLTNIHPKAMTAENFVITIGRQFGAGGRELGRALAHKLGIAYYDKELLIEAAKEAGISSEFFEKADERCPSFISGLFSFNLGANPISYYTGATSISDDSIYKAQCDVIRSLASRGSCVIVGRSADYVLRDFKRVANIYVHAPIEMRCRRIMNRRSATEGPLSLERTRALAERTDKLRANYYNFYTDKRWGDARSYDLTLDSSLLPMDALADVVIAYISARWP